MLAVYKNGVWYLKLHRDSWTTLSHMQQKIKKIK